MPSFVSIDLDDDIRQILEAEARSRGVELSTLLEHSRIGWNR